MIAKTEAFLRQTFDESFWLREHPAERNYRLEHSYRVANIAKSIARAECHPVALAVIAGLLHDIAYCEELSTREDRMNHGRRSAAIARPFLQELGLSDAEVNEICYAIAIHVDDAADFPWERTAFSEIVGDADNIDRFDAYRIYETLQYDRFSELSLSEKTDLVSRTLGRLSELREMKLGSETAKSLWIQRLDLYMEFYQKLLIQLEHSSSVL